CALLRPFAYW
nr:immunoglobulin heavy chain junction region [Mus musculus]NSM03786.1 immunoglobulin heavy chain junction region [Mus musculus]NSM03819.1 immunoglobulin heavy chain junction region [Mus musculus]NSM04127.1 immunoglobulin heavy chain junction region [Mus musculus]NSM04136.1 immunoglobulin heavy chain junction region [Mus musculus]